MIRRAFGNTGLMVPRWALGRNNFGRRLDLEKTRNVIDSAIETGINFFDTADVYGDSRRVRDVARRDPGAART